MPAPTREKTYKDNIVRLIRHYAYDYGYSIGKVASLAGMCDRTLYDRLKTPGKFSLDELNRIARALHIPRGELTPNLTWNGTN